MMFLTRKLLNWGFVAALWTSLAVVAMLPSFSNAFTVVNIPTARTTLSCPRVLLHASDGDDNGEQTTEEEEAKEATVLLVNGQELSSDETPLAAKDPIFSATAAMALENAIETPIEITIQNVQNAGLMGMGLLNPNGKGYETPEELAPLVQGHRVALYFGAGWCPACRELEFMLPQYMKALCESEQKIRLIYVSSDRSFEFQLDRMSKLGLELGVSTKAAKQLKDKYGIWSGMEANDFKESKTTRRSGVPAFVVLDTEGEELKYLNTEADTIAAMADWDLDDPKGVF